MTVDWPKIYAECESWTVIVRDNYHHMDDDEAYAITGLADPEAALAKCRALVEVSVAERVEPGRDAATVFRHYTMFGDDPSIVSPREHPAVAFSAWDDARAVAARLAQP